MLLTFRLHACTFMSKFTYLMRSYHIPGSSPLESCLRVSGPQILLSQATPEKEGVACETMRMRTSFKPIGKGVSRGKSLIPRGSMTFDLVCTVLVPLDLPRPRSRPNPGPGIWGTPDLLGGAFTIIFCCIIDKFRASCAVIAYRGETSCDKTFTVYCVFVVDSTN